MTEYRKQLKRGVLRAVSLYITFSAGTQFSAVKIDIVLKHIALLLLSQDISGFHFSAVIVIWQGTAPVVPQLY